MKCEKLEVWRKSVTLSVEIYRYFANCRDFGFKDQITRSSLSIASNIAEGMEKAGVNDQIRFLDIAKGSAAELATQIYIGYEITYIEKLMAKVWRENVVHILAMLTKLQQSLKMKS